jgi:4-hydroxybenzoate polyprenyltransferase
MNDTADVDLDIKSEDKCLSAVVALGRISKQSSFLYCSLLSMTSLVMGSLVSLQFAICTMMNLLSMFGYAG